MTGAIFLKSGSAFRCIYANYSRSYEPFGASA